jgi:hypothetical protein
MQQKRHKKIEEYRKAAENAKDAYLELEAGVRKTVKSKTWVLLGDKSSGMEPNLA